MKKLNSILWGIVLIIIGVLFALNSLDLLNINIFFDGWWTLFIIVPCTIGLITGKEKTGNLIGLLVGVFLLLSCQDILSFDMLWKLAVPIIIVIVGIKTIMSGIFGNKSSEIMKRNKENGEQIRTGFATFSGHNMYLNGEVFSGAELTAVFGGVKCDLRNAVIEKDCVINACSIFGGIDIFVPDYVNVKVNSNSVFGGVSDKKNQNSTENSITLYVNGTCVFGGVDIK